MKLNRTGLVVGLLASAVALAACSSSGGGSGSSDTSASSSGGASSASSAAGASTQCSTTAIKASGSTAQQNAINAWIKSYTQQCSGASVVYSGGGSGQGITDFSAGKVDFAGSDAALDPSKGEPAKATAACGSQALDIPMVTGPIAIAFKVKGVSDLTLTPALIARIFTGKIKTWDDAAIKAANPSATLPSEKITVFFRSDQSGTTQNFETYLHTAVPTDYPATPSKSFAGGVGQGKAGSQGIQQAVSSTEGGVGYLEWSYAGNSGIPMAKIDNGGGAVALTAESAGKAVAAATITGTAPDLTMKLDYATKAPGAYPLILVTYEIVCSKYKDPAIGSSVKAFLSYTSSAAGQGQLTSVGSAPLPASVLSKVQATVAAIS